MFEPRPAPIVPAAASRRLVPLPAPNALAEPGKGALWLAAHFPSLPLDALLPRACQGRAAVVVTAPDDPRRTVVACNERAARQGIAPGMGLNAALARVPGLRVEERRPAAEAALLGRLGRWALQFTPVVSLEPPGAVLAEVRGSLDLFGGATALVRRTLAGLSAHGLTASIALAPMPRAALWLARAGLATTVTRTDALPGLAARLPLACLHWPEDTVATLAGLGIASVADLVRLPRTRFAARFGPRLLDELDEGFGRRPAPRRRYVVPERFDERVELPAAAEDAALLEPALEHGLARLGAFLNARASGIRLLRVDLLHRARAPTRLSLALARMAGDAAGLRLLLRERLGRCRLESPVDALRLRSGVLLPLRIRDPELFERGRGADPEATARLLDLLRARFGHDAVFSVQPVAEHRPERAFRIAEPGLADGLPVPRPTARTARPLWMLAEPQPLDGWDGTLVTGPERIETGWWDGHDVRRDYYVALSRAGVRLWIFRERPPGQRWFLHGVFG
ncbi:MAG: DNA polymerase Y family protein [Gammaproteobacteria bacterium]|nr:DNA polymerase Y family protein [Gammaproteobacteria bacterium]